MKTVNPLDALIQTALSLQGVTDPTRFLKEVSLPKGSPWCMAFVQYCLADVEEKTDAKSPVFLSGLALSVWDNSPKELRRELPIPGAIAIWEKGQTIHGHCGIVTKVISNGNNFQTVEGNTSPPVGSGGNGIYLKVHPSRPVIGFYRLRGFLLPFG